MEREKIFGWLHEAKSFREIGVLLGRSHSSISRDVKRNRNQNSGEYVPCVAQAKAKRLEKLQREKAPLKCPEIYLYVRRKLRMGWSPEVIAGCLSTDLPGNRIADETIYRYIYTTKKHPKEKLYDHLVLHRKKRMKKHGRKVINSRIPGRIGIADRPQVVALREEFGHGETDLMEGIRSDKPVAHVTVERKTRFVQLQLLQQKTAQLKTQAVSKNHQLLSFKTMTTDNGSENVKHPFL